jgi:hypothetical protein
MELLMAFIYRTPLDKILRASFLRERLSFADVRY